jgi:hypothetical protein
VKELPVQSHRGLLVIISHSSQDEGLAAALINLLRSGVGLQNDQIRYSSVDGYRLPVGVNSEEQLRAEVNATKVVIGLITPSSLISHFVMFELGARWGASRFLAPLLAGVTANGQAQGQTGHSRPYVLLRHLILYRLRFSPQVRCLHPVTRMRMRAAIRMVIYVASGSLGRPHCCGDQFSEWLDAANHLGC